MFQSTRPAWGATIECVNVDSFRDVSIHAPRVGRDHVSSDVSCNPCVSIHAPRVGRDGASALSITRCTRFQSTRPAWGATAMFFPLVIQWSFQSTRPAWGATAVPLPSKRAARRFNPRAPRGARHEDMPPPGPGIEFQSTRPAWGATLATHSRLPHT